MDQEGENTQKRNSIEVLSNEPALGVITRAEIDVQITTAKAFPRSLTMFLKKCMSMATISENVAESCAYALPRAGKTLEGPSVRLAEIVVSSYGNVRAGSRVIYKDAFIVRAQGICHDLETNTCVTVEVERSIMQNVYENGQKTGGKVTMNDDMQVVTGNAACAIAFRNAVFKVIPAALITDVYEKVKEVAKGTAETLPKRREKRLQYFYDLGIKPEQICKALEVVDINDIDLNKVGILQGMITAHKTNESQLEELFPPPGAKEKAKNATDKTAEAIKGLQEKTKAK